MSVIGILTCLSFWQTSSLLENVWALSRPVLGVFTASPLSFGTLTKVAEGSTAELTGRPNCGLQQYLSSIPELKTRQLDKLNHYSSPQSRYAVLALHHLSSEPEGGRLQKRWELTSVPHCPINIFILQFSTVALKTRLPPTVNVQAGRLGPFSARYLPRRP